MHPCINPACYRWGTSILEFVAVSRAAGFTSVEVSIQQAAALAADLGGLAQLHQWITRAGVRVEMFSGIIPAGPVLPAGLLVEPDAFTAALPSLPRRLEVAAALNCPRAAVVVNPRTTSLPDRARALALERLEMLAGRAAEAGITLAVEFIGLTHPGPDLDGPHPFLRTPGELVALLDELGRPDVQVLLDVCHLHAAGTTVADQPGLHGRIGFVQVCDLPPGVGPEQITDSLRLPPGAGMLDYPRLAADLAAAGYNGPLSIELFNPQLWELDPPTAAAQLFAAAQNLPTISQDPRVTGRDLPARDLAAGPISGGTT